MTIQQIVAKKLKLFARRRAVTLLDGNYDSIFKGKGVELDSLRQYVAGDNVKDIDWRSTARTRTVQTRLYTPLRDQRILVVVDTSTSMLLSSRKGVDKRDMVFGLIVMLGMFVNKNRDVLAVCTGKPDGSIELSRFSNSNKHVERILRATDRSLQQSLAGKPPDMTTMLSRVLSTLRQRTAIFIVTDSLVESAEVKPVLSKLSVKHQLFWLQLDPSSPFLNDGAPYDAPIVDIEDGSTVVDGISTSVRLRSEWEEEVERLTGLRRKACASTGTAYGELNDSEKLPEELRKMFIQTKHYAKRR